MTPPKFLIVLLLTVGALMLASTVEAHETAWVLWLQVDGMSMIRGDDRNWVEWYPSGVPTFADCRASLQATFKMQMANVNEGEKIERLTASSLRRTSVIRSSIYTWTCLPASVDPRSPK
jgi:hypothetical protein